LLRVLRPELYFLLCRDDARSEQWQGEQRMRETTRSSSP
jgi:hypothetical protein